MISRRSLISLGPAFLCAPAIIRVAKIMSIRPYPWDLADYGDGHIIFSMDFVNQLKVVAVLVERHLAECYMENRQ
jgi:membrane-associated PAP2 superfamily phosphatase